MNSLTAPSLQQSGRAGLWRQSAADTFTEQAAAISALAQRVDGEFDRAVELILDTAGRVVVCGMGKSGLVGKKIAATLASTGTPSFFMHPAEAFHGDLGMLTPKDVVVLISYSGETEEIIRLIPSLKAFGVPIISIVGASGSTQAVNSSVVLDISVEREVCPNNLAPTTSTMTTMAMGDALAVALIRARGFQPHDFARFHPGGSLGRRLLNRVKDVMHTDPPIVPPDCPVREALFAITQGRLGLTLVVDATGLRGIVTDGDLRRAMLAQPDFLEQPISRIMNSDPQTISEEATLAEAEVVMRDFKIKALVAMGEENRVTGILEIFD